MESKKFFAGHILLFLLMTMCCSFLYSQDDVLFVHRNNTGTITFANFASDENSDRKMDKGVAFLKKMLQTKENDEFRLENETTDEIGITTKRYQQYYKGIKVDNAEYLLHGRNGYIETMSGDFQRVDISKTDPVFNEQQSLLYALKYIGAKKYKGEDTESKKFIQQHLSDNNATYYPKGELVVVKDYLNSKEKDVFKLAGKFSIFSSDPDNAQMIFVDAINCEIIQCNSLIMNLNAPGTAQTLYSGVQDITCDSYFSMYRLYMRLEIQPPATPGLYKPHQRHTVWM